MELNYKKFGIYNSEQIDKRLIDTINEKICELIESNIVYGHEKFDDDKYYTIWYYEII